MAEYLPSGMLGLAITALIASFMAGVAANVSAFNTVVTYDLYQDYIREDADDRHYIRFGRLATVVGMLISIGTAFIAKGYDNIMNYVQLLFSYFNAPLFATFIIGLFWRRATRWGGFAGLVAGTFGAFMTHLLYSKGTIDFRLRPGCGLLGRDRGVQRRRDRDGRGQPHDPAAARGGPSGAGLGDGRDRPGRGRSRRARGGSGRWCSP